MTEKMEKIQLEIEKKALEFQVELVDVEYVKEGGYNYLRVYIERENGNTTLDDCANFSSIIDSYVDDLIDEKYFLEVSTPGIERKLKKPKDFIKFLGNEIKVYSKIQIEGKKTFEGTLEKYDEMQNIIHIIDNNLKKSIEIPLDKIKKSNLVYKMPNGVLNSEEE